MDIILISALRYPSFVLLYSMAILSKKIHSSVWYLTDKETSIKKNLDSL